MAQITDQMTHYETLYVIHPVHGSRNQELKERFQGVLKSRGAEVTHFEEWGLRDLAYPMQKQAKGYYNLIQFKAPAGTTEELERVMRLTEEVMRYLTVALDEDVRPMVVERPAARSSAEEPRAASEPAAEGSTSDEQTEASQEPTEPVQS